VQRSWSTPVCWMRIYSSREQGVNDARPAAS
jgi:hypothetical protein